MEVGPPEVVAPALGGSPRRCQPCRGSRRRWPRAVAHGVFCRRAARRTPATGGRSSCTGFSTACGMGPKSVVSKAHGRRPFRLGCSVLAAAPSTTEPSHWVGAAAASESVGKAVSSAFEPCEGSAGQLAFSGARWAAAAQHRTAWRKMAHPLNAPGHHAPEGAEPDGWGEAGCVSTRPTDGTTEPPDLISTGTRTTSGHVRTRWHDGASNAEAWRAASESSVGRRERRRAIRAAPPERPA